MANNPRLHVREVHDGRVIHNVAELPEESVEELMEYLEEVILNPEFRGKLTARPESNPDEIVVIDPRRVSHVWVERY